MVESPPTSLRIGTGVLGMALLSPALWSGAASCPLWAWVFPSKMTRED